VPNYTLLYLLNEVLSNATSSICWIFVPLIDEAHNPKVVSSNLTPATKIPFLSIISANPATIRICRGICP
jgi:hypothetical protein